MDRQTKRIQKLLRAKKPKHPKQTSQRNHASDGNSSDEIKDFITTNRDPNDRWEEDDGTAGVRSRKGVQGDTPHPSILIDSEFSQNTEQTEFDNKEQEAYDSRCFAQGKCSQK